jgi:hypothetical protein
VLRKKQTPATLAGCFATAFEIDEHTVDASALGLDGEGGLVCDQDKRTLHRVVRLPLVRNLCAIWRQPIFVWLLGVEDSRIQMQEEALVGAHGLKSMPEARGDLHQSWGTLLNNDFLNASGRR